MGYWSRQRCCTPIDLSTLLPHRTASVVIAAKATFALISEVRFVFMLAILIASAIISKLNLTLCPKNRKH
jgi:hypothetical protein